MSKVLFPRGSVYINEGHLLPDDPSAFTGLKYVGNGSELLFDRRTGVWQQTEVFLYNATYTDEHDITVRVNVEFGTHHAAHWYALHYAQIAGRAPTLLREDLKTISIQKGDHDYGGGSGDRLIHTGRTPEFLALGSLDEVIIHEMTHITLDSRHMTDAGWLNAQQSDQAYVSEYAMKYDDREDFAETFLLYYISRMHPSRMTETEAQIFLNGVPDKIAFLDSLGLDLSQFTTTPPSHEMEKIRDFDGNDLGSESDWKLIGQADVQFDGDIEFVFINQKIARWATVGPDSGGNVDFDNYGIDGDTRVVGIYIDPEVELDPSKKLGPFDSQQRFQNDLAIDNLTVIDAFDFDADGFQEIYFKVNDGSAYLRTLMHADGNIQYANYQSSEQVEEYLTGLGYGQEVLDTILV